MQVFSHLFLHLESFINPSIVRATIPENQPDTKLTEIQAPIE